VHTLYLLLYIAAAACFLLATFEASVQRVNLVALGLLLWVLVPLIVLAQTT
jgi:hypothetical protein